MGFEQTLQQLVEKSVLDLVASGKWLDIQHRDRVRLPGSELEKVYQAIDMDRVRELVVAKVEERLATSLINAMATELHTDVKHLLSTKILRTEVRDFLRRKIEELAE